MTGQNLGEKVKTKEILTGDIVKNFSLFAAIASDPNEKIKIRDDEIGVYGANVLETVLKNVSDETKEYLTPVFSQLAVDYNQNGEFSPSSKRIFEMYKSIYNEKIMNTRAIDVLKLAGEYGLKQEDVAKQLNTNSSFIELISKYKDFVKEDDDKFEPKTANEFQAHAVLKSIEYINEYIKANAKGKIWDETVTDYLKKYKDRAENAGKYAKALTDAKKEEILKAKEKLRALTSKEE
jgi:hypothetical protein